jgi:hypothetical protein
MTREQEEELMRLLEGSGAPSEDPLAPMPFAPSGAPMDYASAITRGPAESRGPVADPSAFVSPMDARREADIEAFMSGAPIPQAPAAAPAPQRSAAQYVDSFSAQPGMPALPSTAPTSVMGNEPDPLRAMTLPGMQRPAERMQQRASRDAALLDFWAKERADRPALPEQAPEPRTYAEAQALHPRYRGGLNPEAVAKLPGAPKPAPLPRTYAEAATLPPEQRADVLARFAKLREANPTGDDVYSKFMQTLPGAPKVEAPKAMTPMDEARLANERARLGLIEAQTERAARPPVAPAPRETPEERRAADEERRIREEKRRKALSDEKDAQAQSEAYGKELRTRAVPDLRTRLSTVRSLLPPKGGDVPGFGLTSAVPDFMLSPQGKELRRHVNELLDMKLRAATGAAAPVGEQDTFRKILGIGTLSTDDDLRSALDQVESRIAAAEREVGEMFPRARQAGGGDERKSRTAAIRERREARAPSAAGLDFDPADPLAGARP